MIAEMAVVALIQRVGLPVIHAGWGVADWRAYEAEAALGLLAVAATPWARRRIAR